MTKAEAEEVRIPFTHTGVDGRLEHLYEAVVTGKASAVLAATIFHFREISISEAKQYLKKRGVPVKM